MDFERLLAAAHRHAPSAVAYMTAREALKPVADAATPSTAKTVAAVEEEKNAEEEEGSRGVDKTTTAAATTLEGGAEDEGTAPPPDAEEAAIAEEKKEEIAAAATATAEVHPIDVETGEGAMAIDDDQDDEEEEESPNAFRWESNLRRRRRLTAGDVDAIDLDLDREDEEEERRRRDEEIEVEQDERRRRRDKLRELRRRGVEADRLARVLASRTDAFVLHRRGRRQPPSSADGDVKDKKDGGGGGDQSTPHPTAAATAKLPPGSFATEGYDAATLEEFERRRRKVESRLAPAAHGVELGDWENEIDWEGGPSPAPAATAVSSSSSSSSSSLDKGHGAGGGSKTPPLSAEPSPSRPDAAPSTAVLSAEDLLSQPRNPRLDALDLESSIDWEGGTGLPGHRRRNRPPPKPEPLILHSSVAGRSVASFHIAAPRPTPFGQSDIFDRRMEREMQSTITSTAELSKSLAPESSQLEKLIEARQRKRAQMAKDKQSRVGDVLQSLALGGGKGRRITSSLMGPGGTERTGRPARHMHGSSSAHDAEYVEQPELIFNHVLVKPDLTKAEYRQFHRPRIPLFACRVSRPWQFQVRVTTLPGGAKGHRGPNSADGSTVVGSYHAMITEGSPHAKIRNEADLSPSEGDLVLFEYCEERPPIQMSKGMACRIVNYYRGDRSRCPVSAGGGDRPTRKRHGDKAAAADSAARGSSGRAERPPRLVGPDRVTVKSPLDLIGKIGGDKKSKKGGSGDDEKKAKEPAVDLLPEGVTEILHPKVHGPFISEVEEGSCVTGLISNLFAAPMFRHEPDPTDFLMVIGKLSGDNKSSHKHGHQKSHGNAGGLHQLGVMLRPLPSSIFCIGQTEPRVKVLSPNTKDEKEFTNAFVTYQIAKHLELKETHEGEGLTFDDIRDGLFANTKIPPNQLRQRIRQVANFDRNTQIWTLKRVGFEDFAGVETLSRRVSPEGVAAYEAKCAGIRRLRDLGIHDLFAGSGSIQNVGAAMAYLNGAVSASRERKSRSKKMVDFAKREKPRQLAVFERASNKLDAAWKEVRRKQEVALFIYEELQLAPWHLSSEFIDVHKHGQGSGMMRLTGLGDPSGMGEAFNFLREVDTKPNKGTGNSDGALNAQIKKITGTENDLRKLTMKQMASLLRSYGLGEKQIKILKRWDRVHVIRDLSTKAASDGMGDGLERYARGEKMKLSDQRQMYRDRIQEIWRRQCAALSGLVPAAGTSAEGAEEGAEANEPASRQPVDQGADADSDDSEDYDFEKSMEDEMTNRVEANQLVTAQLNRDEDDNPVRALGSRPAESLEITKDARELAALRRQIEGERAAQEGLGSKAGDGATPDGSGGKELKKMKGRKCIRRKITKTHPDGTQTTTFVFIVKEEKVEEIIAKKKREEAAGKGDEHLLKKKGHGSKHSHKGGADAEQKSVGHAMFEDEFNPLDHRPKPHLKLTRKRRVVTTRKTKGSQKGTKKAVLHLGKIREKASQEKRNKKRLRELEEADLYKTTHMRKGTSNRRERGAARDRMPHVIMSDRLEQIRLSCEQRPLSGPFHRPVSRVHIPRYYEVISEPIDLQTIREKNKRYEYRQADSFVRDFELMKNNAIKFNGQGSALGNEATALYEFVKNTIAANRAEFDSMEEAVQDQLNSGRKRKKTSQKSQKQSKSTKSRSEGNGNSSSASMNTATINVDGMKMQVNLGENLSDFGFGNGDSSDESE